MEHRPLSLYALKPCGPCLSFEATSAIVARMHDNLVRQRVGAIEVVSGLVDDEDVTTRVTLCIDPVSGASYVSEWCAA
jgi:hypothetical protein